MFPVVSASDHRSSASDARSDLASASRRSRAFSPSLRHFSISISICFIVSTLGHSSTQPRMDTQDPTNESASITTSIPARILSKAFYIASGLTINRKIYYISSVAIWNCVIRLQVGRRPILECIAVVKVLGIQNSKYKQQSKSVTVNIGLH